MAGCVPEFENLVLQAITIMRNRTTIVLSSSIVNSIVQNADRIYVMEHGTVRNGIDLFVWEDLDLINYKDI